MVSVIAVAIKAMLQAEKTHVEMTRIHRHLECRDMISLKENLGTRVVLLSSAAIVWLVADAVKLTSLLQSH